MSRRARLFTSIALIGTPLLMSAHLAQAGGSSPAVYRTEFRNGWGDWFELGTGAMIPPTAEIEGQMVDCLVPDDNVVDFNLFGVDVSIPSGDGIGASGDDEFEFSFSIYSTCDVADNAVGSANGISPFAQFEWSYFGESSTDEPTAVAFPCLDVQGTVATDDSAAAELSFEPYQTNGVTTTKTNSASQQFLAVDSVGFSVYLGGSPAPGDSWTITISIQECRSGRPSFPLDFSLPEVEEALPDTL